MTDVPAIEPVQHLRAITRDSDILGDRSTVVSLDRNERVSPLGDDIMSYLLAGITSWDLSGYPNYGPLYDRLSQVTGRPVSQLAIGAGSDALIRRLFHAFVAKGDSVLCPEPTYGMYAVWSRIFDATTVGIDYGADLKLDIDTYVAELKNGHRLAILANPDQPTGAAVPLQDLRRIAAAAAEAGTLFLVDEAYYPFYDVTALPLLDEFPNVVVVRTFSKVWGIAGLRVGYAVGSESAIRALHTVRSPGEVASISAIIAERLLVRPAILEDYRDAVEEGRRFLIDAAQAFGFKAPLCRGNFQLLVPPSGIDAEILASALKERRYLIKSGFRAACLENFVRVTLDHPDTLKPFVAALRDTMESLQSTTER